MDLPLALTLGLIGINLITFLAFGLDKLLAETRSWRIAETTLLLWALVGGTPGAYAARTVFRHKTRKQPFSNRLRAITAVQVVALLVVLGWQLGG
jgi:uncharacterized membrane protein YsdA (DUF1294 family)